MGSNALYSQYYANIRCANTLIAVIEHGNQRRVSIIDDLLLTA
jgi:hypothetical protein